jgi:hypothetical protein
MIAGNQRKTWLTPKRLSRLSARAVLCPQRALKERRGKDKHLEYGFALRIQLITLRRGRA